MGFAVDAFDHVWRKHLYLDRKPSKQNFYLSIYISHSLGDRWSTTRPGNQHSPFLSFLCSPHGVAQFQTRPTPDVIFPSFSLSASPSPSPYSALEDCLQLNLSKYYCFSQTDCSETICGDPSRSTICGWHFLTINNLAPSRSCMLA